MSYRNDYTPVWEAPTASDTVQCRYFGFANPSTSTAVIVFKSEASGADITLNLPAGAYWPAQIVLIKSTGTSGTFLAAKPY